MMGTSGSVSINLENFETSINNATTLADLVVGGVSDQGNLIGLAIGIALAVGLLFGLVFLILGVIPRIMGKIRAIR